MPKRSNKEPWRPRAVLAIDPGEKAGVALFVDGKYVASAPARGDRWTSLTPVVATIMQGQDPTQTLCLIEGGWLSGRGMKSTMTLCMRRGLAQAAAEAAGISHFEISWPSEWQNPLFGSHKVRQGADIKALSVARAGPIAGKHVDEDQADAINLASWYWSTLERKT